MTKKTTLEPNDPRVNVVSAPAGSGKTTLLLHHYLRHLQTVDIERIVAITFTRKAAAELVERLGRILRSIASPETLHPDEVRQLQQYYRDVLPSAERARRALSSLQSAPVSTVDAFTLSLIQANLLHAGLKLSDGSVAWIDGPVSSGAQGDAPYESAARTVLESMDEHVHVILDEMTLGESVRELTFLARNPDAIGAPGTLELLHAVADEVRTAEIDEKTRGEFENNARKGEYEQAFAWLDDMASPPPGDLLRLVRSPRTNAGKAFRAQIFKRAFAKLGLDVGDDFNFKASAWKGDEVFNRAERLVTALRALATRTRDLALRTVAQTGRLSYDELLLAATTLCQAAPDTLKERYDVLMVDELQDTNPAQLAFYKAFVDMRASGDRPISWFFVGDTRQSIYRFRAADPHGWLALLDDAKRAGTWAALTTNYRSARLLVDAQREFVQALRAEGLLGIDALDELTSPKTADTRHPDDACPVHVVAAPADKSVDIAPYTLAAFANRLKARWDDQAPGNDARVDTAAVLVTSWDKGEKAVIELRKHGIKAQLTGDRSLFTSRVATDLRVFLSALLDRSDSVASLGVLKHPSVGFSDAELQRLSEGGSLARVFFLELAPGEEFGIDDEVREKIAFIETARRRLGREPTAEVLEWLAHALRWRAFIHAGPEGEGGVGIAQLELLFDVIRGWESERVDPLDVLLRLDPEREGEEAPVVRMGSGARVVEVTTIHGAKGLEFDHVALLGVDSPGRDQKRAGLRSSVARPQGVSLRGLKLDPLGALKPVADPMANAMQALGSTEATDENWRLFYVGFTRAAKTVTFGIGRANTNTAHSFPNLLRGLFTGKAWCSMVTPDSGALASLERPPRSPVSQTRDFEAKWAESDGWRYQNPSTAKSEDSALAKTLTERSTLVRGPDAPPLPSLPHLDELPTRETLLGTVVHGWLETWAFKGEPSTDDAERYLAHAWQYCDASLAQWLVELGLLLRDGLPGFKELLAHTLHFEWPLLAVDKENIWNGRADLVVELPGKRLVVIDFKAGARFADGTYIPGASTYAAQLEAYRTMLEKSGYSVVEVGLLYVRGVSWVRLRCDKNEGVAA